MSARRRGGRVTPPAPPTKLIASVIVQFAKVTNEIMCGSDGDVTGALSDLVDTLKWLRRADPVHHLAAVVAIQNTSPVLWATVREELQS